MSKYIIELNEECARGFIVFGTDGDGKVICTTRYIDTLEQLNSDYINEHFGDLQDDAYNKGYAQCQDDYSDALKHAKDTAYQKGFEDGKAQSERGCEGCEYEGKTGEHLPCEYCMNNFTNQWRAKKEEIGVGDVVKTYNGIVFAVTKVNAENQVIGFNGDGSTCRFAFNEVTKTGEHYNINEILGGLCDD